MTRRSITQTLCTAALALLAPLAAFARRPGPMALGRNGKWYRARFVYGEGNFRCNIWRSGPIPVVPTGEYPCSKCGQPTLHDEPDPASLRALLAEARDLLTPIVPFKRKDGTLANFTQVHADDITGFVARVDAALK
jgi:hypothetical protein